MTALDEALEALADRGAEWGPRGLSNHGPMAAEALDELGRSDVITRWVAAYRPNLDRPREQERQRISDGSWRDALGQYERIGDWNAYFERALADAPVADVLRTWVPRLAHGLMASTHGAIRTAHAVRAFDREQSAPRLAEVAAGLAYWAARCEDLFGDVTVRGSRPVLSALDAIPRIDPSQRGAFLIVEQVRAVQEVDGFGAALRAYGAPSDDSVALDEVIDAAARAYVACDPGPRYEIAFIHTVTGPSALRMLLPYVDEHVRGAAVAHAWATVAAVQSAYGTRSPSEVDVDQVAPITWDDLTDRAVADGDEHTIKMVEACRREHRRSSSPALVAAARRVVGLPIA